jgi:hypothetical protein
MDNQKRKLKKDNAKQNCQQSRWVIIIVTVK